MKQTTKYLYLLTCVSIVIAFLSACTVNVAFTIGTIHAGLSLEKTILNMWIYNHAFWFLLFSLTLLYFLRFRYGFIFLLPYIPHNVSFFYNNFFVPSFTTNFDFFISTSAIFDLLTLVFGFTYYILLWYQWLQSKKPQP